MSDQLAALVIHLLAAGLILVTALLIRVRGPTGLVKGVDWTRVGDPQGLGQYVSTIMIIIGALIIGHGVLIYAYQGDKGARDILSVGFAALMVTLSLAMLIGQQRYQDKPPVRKDYDRR
ncbi:MAG: hypothetical protein QM741_17350 [Rudaea sp.]|uniref:hypothetical protein n=1 Tax=Rudaea sp. TaxID=2136325 RepID=UPI0039E6A6A3